MSSIAAPPAAVLLAGSAGHVPRRHLYTRLQHDWVRLCATPACLDRARAWSLPIEHVASLDDLLRHSGYGRVGRCTAHHDDVLGRLVTLARHDALAARVVLQRILPGLWSLARRRNGVGLDDPTTIREQDDDVLSTAWTVIRCFRTDHRQDFIAARMLKEVEYRAFRMPHRRLATFVPTTTDALDRPMEQDPLADPSVLLDVVLTDAQRRGLTQTDVLMLRHWGAGTPVDALAAAEQVTERTIRNQRWAALRRLQLLMEEATGTCGADGEIRADHGASRTMSSVSQAR